MRRYPDHQQADDHGDKAHRIGKEAPAFADGGHQNPGDRGTDHTRAVKHRRIQRDCIHHVFLADHLDEEGLPGGNIKRVDHAEQRREYDHFPHANPMSERERGQHECEQHRRGLRHDHHAVPVVTIHHGSAERRYQKNRNLRCKSHQAQHQRRACQPIHKPCLRHTLHPGAHEGNKLPGKEELEVAMPQRAQRGSQFRTCRGYGRVPSLRCR